MLKTNIDIDELIDLALSKHEPRTTNILVGRYGLRDSERKTLAALGDEYNLTRERVRQIESNALDTIRERIKNHREAIKLLEILNNYLEDSGKLKRGENLAHDFSIILDQDDPKSLYNKLNFIADVLQHPQITSGNEHWYVVWHTDKGTLNNAKKAVEKMLKFEKHDFDEFIQKTCKEFGITESELVNYLTISKRFSVGPYGDMGPDHWVHVNPRTVRDKAYLVLKKKGEPLHFTEIASLVNELSDKNRAPATVHNELIKDKRFKLVSRGMYGIND